MVTVKKQDKVINKITRSLNIFVRKTNDVIIFPILYTRLLLSRGHRQSERFLYTMKF